METRENSKDLGNELRLLQKQLSEEGPVISLFKRLDKIWLEHKDKIKNSEHLIQAYFTLYQDAKQFLALELIEKEIQLFINIQPDEFERIGLPSKIRNTPNYDKILPHLANLKDYVVLDIVSSDSVEEAMMAIDRWVFVMKTLLEHYNFLSLPNLQGALSHSCLVSILGNDLENMPPEIKQIMQDVDDLISAKNNFAGFRKKMHLNQSLFIQHGMLPHLSITSKDNLFFKEKFSNGLTAIIENSLPNEILKKLNTDENKTKVNFEISKLINELQKLYDSGKFNQENVVALLHDHLSKKIQEYFDKKMLGVESPNLSNLENNLIENVKHAIADMESAFKNKKQNLDFLMKVQQTFKSRHQLLNQAPQLHQTQSFKQKKITQTKIHQFPWGNLDDFVRNEKRIRLTSEDYKSIDERIISLKSKLKNLLAKMEQIDKNNNNNADSVELVELNKNLQKIQKDTTELRTELNKAAHQKELVDKFKKGEIEDLSAINDLNTEEKIKEDEYIFDNMYYRMLVYFMPKDAETNLQKSINKANEDIESRNKLAKIVSSAVKYKNPAQAKEFLERNIKENQNKSQKIVIKILKALKESYGKKEEKYKTSKPKEEKRVPQEVRQLILKKSKLSHSNSVREYKNNKLTKALEVRNSNTSGQMDISSEERKLKPTQSLRNMNIKIEKRENTKQKEEKIENTPTKRNSLPEDSKPKKIVRMPSKHDSLEGRLDLETTNKQGSLSNVENEKPELKKTQTLNNLFQPNAKSLPPRELPPQTVPSKSALPMLRRAVSPPPSIRAVSSKAVSPPPLRRAVSPPPSTRTVSSKAVSPPTKFSLLRPKKDTKKTPEVSQLKSKSMTKT